MMLLEARGIEAGYGSSRVLHGIDLEVRPGECVSLLGRNGMGKTTMFNALMGLVPGRRGFLSIGGTDAAAWPSHRIAQAGLALVPEGRQVFPNLSVRENLIATARQRISSGRTVRATKHSATDHWTLDRVLGLFPLLEPRLDSMGNLLSGGEQQMLAIGRALMTNPSLLLLDDATEGLAPRIRAEIWRVLVKLKAGGLAVLIVDKNVRDLLPLVDRHHLMEKGRIVWQGSGEALTGDAAITARYLGI